LPRADLGTIDLLGRSVSSSVVQQGLPNLVPALRRNELPFFECAMHRSCVQIVNQAGKGSFTSTKWGCARIIRESHPLLIVEANNTS
jgi:hypothetical protein